MEFNFKHWKAHFEESLANREVLDLADDSRLTAEEWLVVARSIPQFEAGENSDGREFTRRAADFLADHPDKSYLESVRLFIREEQGHAAYLKTFMDREGIEPLPVSTGVAGPFACSGICWGWR